MLLINRTKIVFLSLVVLIPTLFVEAAPRKVICENFTATWCGYCPDVANGIILLMEEFPETCFSMQIHGSDAYSTNWGNLRNVFYSVPGFPTVWLNGQDRIEGSYGSPQANYSQLRSRYLNLANTSTDVTITMCGSSIDEDTYSVTANVGIESDGSGKTMYIHVAQVLSSYPSSPSYNYGCFKQAAVETISLKAGMEQAVNFTFDLDSSSQANQQNVYYIAWAQEPISSGPAEIYQAEKHIQNSGDCQIDNFVVGPNGDFATITEAISNSGTGDSILVMPGTYYENIDLTGASIVLESAEGPENTIIDGSSTDCVVRMYSYESSTIRGFTIQNGSSPIGGGILCNASPIIENCVFRNNVSQLGAGVYHYENGTQGPAISNTKFCSNTGTDIHGVWIDNGGNVFEPICEEVDCPADITGDFYVNVSDLLAVIDAWGTGNSPADITGDGAVNVSDLLEVVGNWGSCE